MIKYAGELNLNVPLDQSLVNVLFQKQDSAMERYVFKKLKGKVYTLKIKVTSKYHLWDEKISIIPI